jgi:Alpha/beta hydrolase domain
MFLATLPCLQVSAGAAPQLVATPRATALPITAVNRPFLAASHSLTPIDLPARGYIEEELLVSGLANVYSWQGGGTQTAVAPRLPATAFATRILVRRPLDVAKFSGRVVLELLNPTGMYDTAPLWGYSAAYFLRRGDIWVGVTVKPVAAKALQRFDAVRYANLSFAMRQAENCASAMTPDSFMDAENGLAWDVIAQTGALLRSSSKDNPLLKYNPQRIVVAGYSQTGGYIATFAKAFHRYWRLGNGRPIFDAYLNATGTVAMPINQCEPMASAGSAVTTAWTGDVPYVAVMTQTEVKTDVAQRDATKRGASVDPAIEQYRGYEIPGAVHWGSFTSGQPANADLAIAGLPVPGALPCRDPASTFPTKFALNAIWQQLEERLKLGTAMATAETMQRDQAGRLAMDALGHAKGGWRLPMLDVPTAQFRAENAAADDKPFSRAICELVGASKNLSVVQLKGLYGSRLSYQGRLEVAIEAAVRERRLLREDATELRSMFTTGVPQF